MASPDALSLFQVGVQSAFGSPVAATAQLAVPRVDFEESGARHVPMLAKGLLVRNRGNEFVVSKGTIWRITDAPFYYEQAQLFFGSLIEGGVEAVDTCCEAPFTWDFSRDMVSDPALDYLTLERRARDFSNNVDMEVGDCLLSSYTLRYVENEPLRFSCEGFGRAVDDTSTLTSSLTMPTPEFSPSALMEVYIDTSWANLGNTKIAAQVIGAEWTFNSGYMPKPTADGRSALDYTLALLNAEQISMSLRLTLLMDPTRYDLEQAAAQAQTLRAIRQEVTGTSDRHLNIDGLYKYASPDLLGFEQQDGQVVVTLELEETNDGTNMMAVELINNTDAADGVGA